MEKDSPGQDLSIDAIASRMVQGDRMKKLFLGLSLVLCQISNADTLATAKNNAGGVFVLTDVPCKNGNGYHMYSQSNGNRTLFGCWWSDSSMVHVTYSDGEVRSYPLEIWEVNMEVANRTKKRERSTL